MNWLKRFVAHLVLLLFVYFSPSYGLIERVAALLLPVAFRRDPIFKQRAETMRKRFWTSFLLVIAVVGFSITILYWLGHSLQGTRNILRIIGAFIAITATLGRGGWSIQSYKGNTLSETLDRWMYVLGQLGAAAFLVIALGL